MAPSLANQNQGDVGVAPHYDGLPIWVIALAEKYINTSSRHMDNAEHVERQFYSMII